MLEVTHLVHKDQPRPNGANSEAGIPALPKTEGCKGALLLPVDPNHSYSCSAFAVTGWRTTPPRKQRGPRLPPYAPPTPPRPGAAPI